VSKVVTCAESTVIIGHFDLLRTGLAISFAAVTNSCAMGMMLAKPPRNCALDEKARADCHPPNAR
jgi:hypothetical protein